MDRSIDIDIDIDTHIDTHFQAPLKGLGVRVPEVIAAAQAAFSEHDSLGRRLQ